MRFYHLLSGVPFIEKSFSLKILFVAFIGIHIPLFGIIGYLLSYDVAESSIWNVALLTLLLTLFATAITLFILNKLLKPVLLAKNALLQFKKYSKLPNLPKQYNDEGGVLMREVQQTVESLSKIDDERENVLHLLRHDLQGPINHSLSVLDLVQTDSLDQESIELLQENFKTQRKRLLNSIEYIKSQRNLQDQKESLVAISIKQLISNVVDNLQIEAKAKKIDFELSEIQEVTLPLPDIILDRVLTNLLDNAIKYSPEFGQVKISSTLDEKLLTICIKDSGPGIPKEAFPSLFEVKQVDTESYNSKEPSMGLGLYLCQKLMQSVGGRIIARNNETSTGAVFVIEYVHADDKTT